MFAELSSKTRIENEPDFTRDFGDVKQDALLTITYILAGSTFAIH